MASREKDDDALAVNNASAGDDAATAEDAVDLADLNGEESCCEKKFFDEREQVAQLLRELLAKQFPAHESDVDAEFELKFNTITAIVRSTQ